MYPCVQESLECRLVIEGILYGSIRCLQLLNSTSTKSRTAQQVVLDP
jgi:hypothetical protein